MEIKKIKFSIIGGGVMGESIVRSLRNVLKIPARNITVLDKNSTRRRYLSNSYKAKSTVNYLDVLLDTKIIFISVKPEQFKEIAAKLKGNINKDTIVISIMAGISSTGLKKRLAHDKVIRTMPNMAAQMGLGVTLWYAGKNISVNAQKIIRKILSSFGREIKVIKEKDMDSLTLVTGSGPAYLFNLAEILKSYASKHGLSAKQAKATVIEMLSGALEIYLQSSEEAGNLKHKVSSKGGVTEAMFDILLKKYKVDRIWAEAFANGLRQSSTLRKKYE